MDGVIVEVEGEKWANRQLKRPVINGGIRPIFQVVDHARQIVIVDQWMGIAHFLPLGE
ncbi:hypothetical protein D3C72_1744620 [compost metagenome]